uniref:Interferon alpha-inducible protein 27-like protein 2A n=1 Tax=Gopherus evgoodei TaxID=1825980 RepID=A0A8C4VZ93_9SAUR
MEAKASESPCAELAPAALALPWPETGSPPVGEPSQEAELLFEQMPAREEQAEMDIEEEPESEPEPKSSSKAMKAVIGAGVGIGVAVIGAPLALGAAGFTGAGIAAGSMAAKMMSAAAIASGGGVAAGSLVATLQSVGKPMGHREVKPHSDPGLVLSCLAILHCHTSSDFPLGGRAKSLYC